MTYWLNTTELVGYYSLLLIIVMYNLTHTAEPAAYRCRLDDVGVGDGVPGSGGERRAARRRRRLPADAAQGLDPQPLGARGAHTHRHMRR